ncbi:MAG: glycosyltransferase family 2 protein [Archaeoglobaceae archaeon]
MSVSNGETTTTGDQMTRNKLKVVAALPAYNEEVAIGSVVLGARNYVDQVVVVDDGSTDRTAEIAEAAGAIVLKHEVNTGYGGAIKDCFEVARTYGADVLVILDGDGQHDPSDIPSLVEPVVQEEADIVIGSRFNGKENKIPFYRRLGIRTINIFTNVASNGRVTDTQSGFRAYSRRAIDSLDVRDTGMGVSSEILLSAKSRGLSVKEKPICCRYDLDGSTHGPVGHGMSVINSIFRFVELERPIISLALPGLALIVIGIFLGFRVLDFYVTRGELATGHALGTVLLVLVGMLAIFVSMVLHAIKISFERYK